MPRVARQVFANVPHHITQRGNRRGDVFFDDADRRVYLDWLEQYSRRFSVRVLAYCLMTNHVHIVAIPGTKQALEQVFRPLHTRYAQRVNRAHGWAGHLWQGRYFSAALDDTYLWAAIRYVERNPVRARMVHKAEDYPWSSASAHCGLKADAVLDSDAAWFDQSRPVDNWSEWLSQDDDNRQLDVLRRNVESGHPCGSDAFVDELERAAGRALRPRGRGRPAKNSVRPH